MNDVVFVRPDTADKCEDCDGVFIGLTGSTKWCPYCGAKHEGATVKIDEKGPLPAPQPMRRRYQAPIWLEPGYRVLSIAGVLMLGFLMGWIARGGA